MSYDGSNLICEKHEIQSYYSDVVKKWLCVECELEEKDVWKERVVFRRKRFNLNWKCLNINLKVITNSKVYKD